MLDKDFFNGRIIILDGAMGTMLQRYGLAEEDFHTDIIDSQAVRELKGNNECLNLSHPEIIREIHLEYIKAGADIIESNTFSANKISQKEYGTEALAYKMAFEGARIARQAADSVTERRILVAGSVVPHPNPSALLRTSTARKSGLTVSGTWSRHTTNRYADWSMAERT